MILLVFSFVKTIKTKSGIWLNLFLHLRYYFTPTFETLPHKYATQFNQRQLKLSLKDMGIKYKYLVLLWEVARRQSVLSSDGKIIREYINKGLVSDGSRS
jgi:hypothetical protein